MPELKRKQPPDPASEQDSAHQKRRLTVSKEEEDFYKKLAKNVKYAWLNRNKEHPLYHVFHTISGRICETVCPKGHPSVSVSTVAQYPFGSPVAANGPSQKSSDIPSEIPDFIKPLDVEVAWNSPGAREEAEKEIPKHIFQVYSEAMAAFIRNPEWKKLYAWLIVGIYYTQFFWKRPEGDIRPPVYFDYSRSIPHKVCSPQEHQALLDLTQAAIEECEAREMPTLVCWNEPFFTFPDRKKNPHAPALKLSPQLLWSMHLPFKDEVTEFQPIWLAAPSKMPSTFRTTNADTKKKEAIEVALRHGPLNALREHKYELQKSLPPTPASLEARKRQGLVNEDEADWEPNPKRMNKGKGKARATQRTPSLGGKKKQRAGQPSRQPRDAASLLVAIQTVKEAAGEGQAALAGPVEEHETPIRPIALPLQGAARGESSAMGSSRGENISVVFPRIPENHGDGEKGKRGKEMGPKAKAKAKAKARVRM